MVSAGVVGLIVDMKQALSGWRLRKVDETPEENVTDAESMELRLAAPAYLLRIAAESTIDTCVRPRMTVADG